MSTFIGYICLIYVGALITIYLAKTEIVPLDKATNAVTPTLVGLLIGAVYIGLKVMGV